MDYSKLDSEILALVSLAKLPIGGLPILPPIAAHGQPLGVGALDPNILDITCTCHLPAEVDGDDTGTVGGDFEEHRHGEIEVEAGRVTPAAIVVGQGEVGRAEVSGGDHNRRVSGEARSVIAAFDLEACPAAQPAVEQRRAQRRIVNPIPLRVQIPISTSTRYTN
nr:hypothetical protein GW17_00027587 [Ipomoea trifida]